MNLDVTLRNLVNDAIHLILIRDRLPELSLQVIHLYYEVVSLRTWHMVSDKEEFMIMHFETLRRELQRRVDVLCAIYEFERIEVPLCTMLAC